MQPHERQPSYAAAFAAALVDPELETPVIVAGPAGKGAVKRYNLYRNNVTVSLIDTLAAVYPAVQRITGVDFFRAPWLADTARLERAWLDAYHAEDAAPLSAETLAAVAPERLADLVFIAHPATRIVRSPFSVVTIFAANRSGEEVGRIDASSPEDALITRPDLDVVVRHLPTGGAVFLLNLMTGQSLGEAAASALQASPAFDIAANIAGLIEAGAFAAITFGDA